MITTIFFDIGGVLLTDGWGHESRRAAAELTVNWMIAFDLIGFQPSQFGQPNAHRRARAEEKRTIASSTFGSV